MLRRAAKLTVLVLLRSYRYCISAFLPPSCRFFPSCSEYATQAVERFGVIKGVCLASSRICRCHPFHRGGHDPVPDMDDRA